MAITSIGNANFPLSCSISSPCAKYIALGAFSALCLFSVFQRYRNTVLKQRSNLDDPVKPLSKRQVAALPLLFGNTNIKHSGKGVRLLATVTKREEDQRIAKMARKEVMMFRAQVVVCEPNQPFFLYTEGLGPCVAALAFCQLKDRKRLMGCAHITPGRMNGDIRLLNDLVEEMEKHPNYQGEKIEFYFAGGCHDFRSDSNFTSDCYDSYCLYVKGKKNLELRGVLFDPFQLTHEISHAIDWPYSSEEVRLAREENPSKKNEMDIEFIEARHIGTLLSCRAGITSEGEPLIRKLVDISFEYNPLKFPNYKKIKEYYLLRFKIDITQIEQCAFH